MSEAENEYTLSLSTPDGTIYSGDIVSMVAPGLSGKLGILSGHMPLLCVLKAGPLVCREKGGRWLQFDIGEGVLRITPEGASVLSDTAIKVPIRLAPRF